MPAAARLPRPGTFVFEDDGAEMVVTRSGRADGTPFVLVHGIGMGRRVFDGLAAVLGHEGPVFAVDLPGFGDAPEPERARDIPATGDLVAALVRTLPVTDPVLVGHSMGTQVVAEAIARHPDIAGRAVLIAPTVNPRECTAAWQAWRMVQDLAIESPKVLALGLWQYAKAGPRWFLRKLRLMLHHRIEDVLPHVPARTLVLRGENDWVCPRDWVRHATDLLPDGRMQEIPGRGHEAMIRTPEPAAAAIIAHARGRGTGESARVGPRPL